MTELKSSSQGIRAEIAAPCSWFSGHDADSIEVADPAGRALFFSGDHFEGSVGGDGFAVFRVSDEDMAGVDSGVDFGERVQDLIAVSAFGDDTGHEETAANLFSLRHAQFGEEGCERHSGVGFAHFGMCVVDSDGGLRQRRELGGAEGEGFVLICNGEASGPDNGSVMVHCLRRDAGNSRAGQKEQCY